jgi:hypothetical protein
VSALLTAAGGWALYGRASATTGPTVAAQGINDSDQGTAMSGWARATSGATIGLVGSAASTGGIGLKGRAYATSGATTGILATINSPSGTGLVINNVAGGKLFSGQYNGVETISMAASGTLNLPQTTSLNVGVITMNGNPFIHAYGTENTFLGQYAGNFTSTGDVNTGIGYGALFANTSGYSNTATGEGALFENTTGYDNSALGEGALNHNSTGTYNTASGGGALRNNTSGNDNTAIGWFALGYNCASVADPCPADLNTGVGFDAGITYLSATPNLSGARDTFLGAYSGPAFTPQVNNATAIGANAAVGESNALVLGSINGVNGATADVKVGIGTTTPTTLLTVGPNPDAPYNGNELLQIAKTDDAYMTVHDGTGVAVLGTTSGVPFAGAQGATSFTLRTNHTNRVWVTATGEVGIATASPDDTLSVNGGADKTGGGSWATFSDARLKNIDGRFAPGIEQIMQLQPIYYRYKKRNGMSIRDHAEHVGLVAQAVQKVIPEAVTKNSKGYLLVSNDPIIWAMLNAIKEQQKEIRNQRAEIQKLVRSGKKKDALATRLGRTERAKDARLEALAAQNRRLAGEVERLEKQVSAVAALEARLNRDEAQQKATRSKLARVARRQKKQPKEELARVKF